ncbi:MAG TPA: UDP-N-acetylglucosamine pyrophosphorylase [Kiritimatiellia bacterium]|nr:UDP-N-acetylglucosamine pyrophosphorylase [Kiritimatiellia bacterium]
MNRIEEWLGRGVNLPAPGAVEIGDEVDPGRVAPGVTIHAGCKVYGARTSLGPGCVLGREAPATVEDCQLGENVELKGGYFSGAVFLDGAAMGSGAQVRPGTILEEGAEMAHTVGLKQTIFFPFVVGGSLINFCDALMAGGRSRKEHSEIGSSFIHFNYTPHGDKATASLFGDVPRGVMLDQAPIFLGGQGGVAGPVRMEYGTVQAAGLVSRRDVLEPGRLVVPEAPAAGVRPYGTGYRSVARVVRNCAIYIGNIAALQAWYEQVRRPLLERTPHGAACLEGARKQLASVRKERMKRLEAVVERIAQEDRAALDDALRAEHEALCAGWPAVKERLAAAGDAECREKAEFLAAWEAAGEEGYVERVRGLPAAAKAAGTAWLQQIVESAGLPA